MKIKDLKYWLSTLPEELDENDLVFRNVMPGDKENWLVQDTQIAACGIDAGRNEAYFCDEMSSSVLKKY